MEYLMENLKWSTSKNHFLVKFNALSTWSIQSQIKTNFHVKGWSVELFLVIWRENHKQKVAFGWGGKINRSCEYRVNFILERQNHTGMKLILLSCEESLSLC